MALSSTNKNILGGLLGGGVLGFLIVQLGKVGDNLLVAVALGALAGLAIAGGALFLRRLECAARGAT